jgi:hypothetical protein
MPKTVLIKLTAGARCTYENNLFDPAFDQVKLCGVLI